MFLYPGGHIDANDKDTLQAAIREIKEETGLTELNQIIIANDKNFEKIILKIQKIIKEII